MKLSKDDNFMKLKNKNRKSWVKGSCRKIRKKKQMTKKRTLYDCVERPEEGCRNNKICWIVQ